MVQVRHDLNSGPRLCTTTSEMNGSARPSSAFCGEQRRSSVIVGEESLIARRTSMVTIRSPMPSSRMNRTRYGRSRQSGTGTVLGPPISRTSTVWNAERAANSIDWSRRTGGRLALCRAAPVLRIVVHLELTIDLRDDAAGGYVGREPGELLRQVVALFAHDLETRFAAFAKVGSDVVAGRLLSHVIDLQLDDRDLIDERADRLSHLWLRPLPVRGRWSPETPRRCAR